MTDMKKWLEKDETKETVVRTIQYTSPTEGETISVELEMKVLSGIDKEKIEAKIFGDKTASENPTSYRRAIIMATLGLSQKQLDTMYRKKPAVAMEQIEDVCMRLNSSRYLTALEEQEKLKNLVDGGPPETD